MKRYDRPCDCRVLLFTERGVELNVPARTVDERTSYERLAKQNIEPMSRALGWIHGAVVVIDNETQTSKTTWSKRGVSPSVKKMALAWLKANGSQSLIADWKARNP